MSWFKRLRSFVEEEDILADDFEAEFDGIANALNGLFQVGSVSASESLATTEAYKAIPGTAEEINLAVASKVLVTAVFDMDDSLIGQGVGALFVDGVVQPGEAHLIVKLSGEATNSARTTVAQTFAISLAAGSHTLELRAKRMTASAVTVWSTHTRYTYLATPNPEP